METFRLKSMVNFVLENAKQPYVEGTKYKDLVNYAKFLKQPLNLGMFVPCDDNLNILEEPIFHEPNNENEIGNYEKLIEEYYEAKEKVLFEGFHIEGNKLCYSDFYFGTIYDISNLKVENLLSELPENEMPKLMLSAIKKIGL